MIRKKRIDEVSRTSMVEFELTVHQRSEFERGVALFNQKKFWEAHEAWEAVWKEREEDARIFFQGLVQAAAALHLLVTNPRFTGMMRNFEKSLEKLELFPENFLGINVERLRRDIQECQQRAKTLGSSDIRQFPGDAVPSLHLSPSSKP